MDHAYTMSGTVVEPSANADNITEDEEEDVENELEDAQEYSNDYETSQDHMYEEDGMDDGQEDGVDENVDTKPTNDHLQSTYTVLLPTEEWMQMLPPHYLLHYIRERTVYRESGRAIREGRETFTPLKRGWLQGAWRETLKEAISKQTGIPCVLNFHSSNFLKQPFSRKVGPPLWRVRACCRQDDGQCLRFSITVQDFHPSKPHVEMMVTSEGTILDGPEGERRHTFTTSDHIRAIKSMQRYSIPPPQPSSDGSGALEGSQEQEDSAAEEGEVQRFKLLVPMQKWISFLPPEAADAYVQERSRASKDRLAVELQDVWSRGSRQFQPRVTKECRLYLKRALAELTGLPCRIGLTGRCHLKPPFSRKKRAPLFVTNGFCGRKDFKCLRFKFVVQDFDPEEEDVTVSVEVRGQLLTGPEGEERHSRRPSEEAAHEGRRSTHALKRTAAQAEVGDGDGDALQGKRRKGRPSMRRTAASPDAAYNEQAVQSLQAETWPADNDFDLQSAEVVLDDGRSRADVLAGVAEAAAIAANTIEVVSDAGQDTPLGEDAARELVQLANEALNLAGDGMNNSQLTATKIVQSGDQVFIFVSDPAAESGDLPPTIEAVEINKAEFGGVQGALPDQEAENILNQFEASLTTQEPEPLDDTQCMEYHWEMQIAMADWLRLLPPKSLRFYIHERTVGREVWVEEGWEKQFRCQTLQHGWRDVIRRAVVEQTDIPCQVCFRGRSSLKLPFSRKHSAALWRTQGYCAQGDRHCLIYKFCVQDFHPDDETVTVQVTGVGKLHRTCRRWFHGVGTPVPDPLSLGHAGPLKRKKRASDDRVDMAEMAFADLVAQVKREPVDLDQDEWETDPLSDSEREQDEAPAPRRHDAEHGGGDAAVKSTPGGEELYQAVLKSIDTLKDSLSGARRCPLKMQAALRLVRNADTMAAAPCRTPDCLCRPTRTAPRFSQFAGRLPGRALEAGPAATPVRAPATPARVSPGPIMSPDPVYEDDHHQDDDDGDDDHHHDDELPVELRSPTPPPSVVSAARPAPVVSTPPPLAATARPAATSPGASPTTPSSSPRAKQTVVTTKPLAPTIIKLTPAQMAAGSRSVLLGNNVVGAVARSKLVQLSTAIERSALPTAAVIKPITPPRKPGVVLATMMATPRATPIPKASSTPAAPKPLSPRALASSARDSAEDSEQDDGGDPSWIMEEMRSVILDGASDEEDAQPKAAEKGKEAVAPNEKAAESGASSEPAAKGRVIIKSPTPIQTAASVKGRVIIKSPTPSEAVGTAREVIKSPTPSEPAIVSMRGRIIKSTTLNLAALSAKEKVIKSPTPSEPAVSAKEKVIKSPTPSEPAVSAKEKVIKSPTPSEPAVSAKEKVIKSPAPSEPTVSAKEKVIKSPTPSEPAVSAKGKVAEKPADSMPLLVTDVRSMRGKPAVSASAAKPSAIATPPSRPVTRGTKVIVSAPATVDPPPLIPISKGNAQPKVEAAALPTPTRGKGARVVVMSPPTPAKAVAAPPVQPAKTPTRTVQTRLLTSVSADKSPFPKGGKVLILKPSAPILRSSARKPS